MNELITRNDSIFDFNCNKNNDRLKINKFNKIFNQYLINQNLIHQINKYKFEEEIHENKDKEVVREVTPKIKLI